MSSIALRGNFDTTLPQLSQLSDDERRLFADAEQAIEKGLHEVWTKLKLIHDHTLYREEYASFETYCVTRWQRTRQWGYQQVEAGRVYEVLAEQVSTNGLHFALPTSERQTRPLASLPTTQVVEAWTKATQKAGNGVPSTAVVEAVVRALQLRDKTPAPKAENSQKQVQEEPKEASQTEHTLSDLSRASLDVRALYEQMASMCFDMAQGMGQEQAAKVREVVTAALFTLLSPLPSRPRVICLPAARCAGLIAPPPPVIAAQTVEEAAKVDVQMARRGCWIDGDETILRQKSPVHNIIHAIKQMPGNDWNPAKRWWTVPLHETAGAVLTLVETCDFAISDADRQRLRDIHSTYTREVKFKRERFFALSNATEGSFKVPSFERVHTLYPYQRAGVQALTEAQSAFLGDDRGVGKTVQALAAIEFQHAYPALIVCTKNTKTVWREHLEQWLPGRYRVQVVQGTQVQIDQNADVIILNYDILCSYIEALLEMDLQAIVLDESHKIKTWESRRTKAALRLSRESRAQLRFCLSGTAVMNKAAEFAPQLEFLGRLKPLFGGARHFEREYTNMGQGGKNLSQLNCKLRQTCYIRREKADVLDQLPAKQRIVSTIDVDLNAYLKKERELIEALRAQQAEDAAWDGTSKEKQQDGKKPRKVNAYNSIMALRRILGLAKVGAAIEWIADFLEDTEARNGKLVVFAWHTDVVEAIAEHFDAPKIRGGVSEGTREAAIKAFQNDPGTRLIICNIIAASEGITLTAASDTLFVELGWNPGVHDQAEDRVNRIGQTADRVTATYLLTHNTIEKWIMEIIEDKRGITTLANTGEEVEGHDESNLVKYLTDRLIAKGADQT